MIKPPKEIQDQFASIVEKAQSLKTLYQQSLNEFEQLYGALSQNAFKGELNLSRIPIEKTSEPPTNAKDSEPKQLPLPLPLFDHKERRVAPYRILGPFSFAWADLGFNSNIELIRRRY